MSSPSRRITSVVLPLLAAGLLCVASAAARAQGATIAPETLARQVGDGAAPLILDVRTPGEFSAGHIPGAVNIPVQELVVRIGEIAGTRDAELVLHCETGPRADYAAQVLQAAGFTHVVQLQGHMQGWRGAGLPTTSAGCVAC